MKHVHLWLDDTHVHVWREKEHPRGQPENSGEFASAKGSGRTKAKGVQYPLADKDKDGWYANGDYQARGGKIIYMSPDAYIASVRPLDIDESSRDNIDELKQHIKDGGKLDPLVIYPDGKEDGRHRAYAAKELGIKSVPVIVYPKASGKL